ncbi:transposase family protein [Brachybacterium sp. UMB0905]|uniref:transposase family protein n=1 Tax=Brachybacterium sp. UMB0905 TaxID=2069310 RepID=UPI00350FE673
MDHEPVYEGTGSQRDAASTIFNLPNYRVIDAVDLPDGGRRAVVVSTVRPGCPSCGVLATKVHSSRSQRVRDIPGSSQMAV